MKIQQISELTQTLPLYQESELLSLYREGFLSSELGQVYRHFPFGDIARSFSLKASRLGRSSYFSAEGKIALMLLKSYTSLSDKRLVELINGSIYHQLFCGIFIRPGAEIKDLKIVSKIRCELASSLDMDRFQKILAQHWKPLMDSLGVVMADATCYESHLRFPTDEKLLWESIEWTYSQIVSHCSDLKLRRPRSKFDEIAKRYTSFSKTRKKTLKKKYKLRVSLIYLLDKLLGQLQTIERQYRHSLALNDKYYKRCHTIKEILIQQKQMQQTRKSCPERIVSIDKPYIRPIVRGKETKSVEFGAKVNLIQIDGINFIEHIDFKAFNEGTRGISSIHYAQMLFRKKTTHFAADSIYATNKTRKYCSSRPSPVYTCFKPKGKKAKDEAERSKLRSLLSKERSTRLEGSFGTEKEHYNLRKIKARTERTEILWILFGIHTANVVRISKKTQEAILKQTA